MLRIFTKFLSCYMGLSIIIGTMPAQAYTLPPESFNNFYTAASEGDLQTIVNAQHRGLDINATNSNGDTALCVAIKKHDYLAYRTLVRLGAATNPRCIDDIPTYTHKSFLNDYNAHYRITTGAESTSWGKKGIAAVLGAGAAAGVVALLSSGGGGGSHASDDNTTCKQNKCAAGCYTNITCSVGQQCTKTNDCGGCEKCELSKECATDKCAVGCYTDLTCSVYEKCTSKNNCGGCEKCSVRSECTLNKCARGCYENITCPSDETCSARNDCGGCTACTKKDQPIVTIPIENCEVYNKDGIVTGESDTEEAKGLCYACRDQYMVIADGKACMSVDNKIDNCTTYNISEKCTACKTGYLPAENGERCREEIPNCQTYNSDDECTSCMQGYTFSEDMSACVAIIDHCSIYTKDGTCRTCENGYSLDKSSQYCSKTIENCVDYNEDGTCKQCTTGYEPHTSGKYCVNHIDNCEIYNTAHTLCTTCSEGYVPSDNQSICIQLQPNTNIPYCKTYTDENHFQCEECYTGFELNPINQLSCTPNENTEPGSSELYVANNSELTTPVSDANKTQTTLDGSNDIIGFTALPDDRQEGDPSQEENDHFYRTGDSENYSLYDIYNSHKAENGASSIRLNINAQSGKTGSIKGMATTLSTKQNTTLATLFNGYGNTEDFPATIDITYTGNNNYNVYGIYSDYVAYNSYTTYDQSSGEYQDGYGNINITTDSRKDENYGIYANVAAYNAAGGTGNITLRSDNVTNTTHNYVGMEATTAYNAYAASKYSREYSDSTGTISLSKGGTGMRGEYLYNAYSGNGGTSNGTIEIHSIGKGMALRENLEDGAAYNAYGIGANGTISIYNTDENIGSTTDSAIYGMYNPNTSASIPFIAAAHGGSSTITIENGYSVGTITGIYNGNLDDTFKEGNDHQSIGRINITENGSAQKIIGIENGTINDPSEKKSDEGSYISIQIEENTSGLEVYGIKSVTGNPSGYILISDSSETDETNPKTVYGIEYSAPNASGNTSENTAPINQYDSHTKIAINFHSNKQNSNTKFCGLKNLHNHEGGDGMYGILIDTNGGKAYAMYGDAFTINNYGTILIQNSDEGYGMYGYKQSVTNSSTGIIKLLDVKNAYGLRISSSSSSGTVTATNNGTINIENTADNKVETAYGICAKSSDNNGNINANIINSGTINVVSGASSGTAYGIYLKGSGTVYNTSTIDVEASSDHGTAYGIYFKGSGSSSSDNNNVVNKSTITIAAENVYGIYGENANIFNNAKITLKGAPDIERNGNYYVAEPTNKNSYTFAQKIYGIYAKGGTVVNGPQGDIEFMTSALNGEIHSIYLIDAIGYNEGTIGAHLYRGKGYNNYNIEKSSAAVYLNNSTFINRKNIILLTYIDNDEKKFYGSAIMATNNSKYYNAGHIYANNIPITGHDQDQYDAIKKDDSSSKIDEITYNSKYSTTPEIPDAPSSDDSGGGSSGGDDGGEAPLSIFTDSTSQFVMLSGGQVHAQSISGTINAGSDITTSGFADEYRSDSALFGDVSNLSVISDSHLFTASLQPNADNQNASDIVMTRKSFAAVTPETDLAEYLETNYDQHNAEESLFNPIKRASTATEYRNTLYKSLGINLLPNFAQENFGVFRSLNSLMTNNLYSTPLSNERMMVGYDFLSLSRSGHKGITGYKNYSNSSYFIGDIPLDKYSRFGLGVSITRFESDYDDSSDRDETFFQALASYMYDFKNNWTYAGVLHGGYGFGDYKRYTDSAKYEANLHEGIYGLNNEIRYAYELPYFTFEPQLEMNINGYYQRRIKETHKEGALNINGTNNLSVENGIGLYASKSFSAANIGSFKGRIGASYYHEWAHPYHTMKAHMYDTVGYYKINSDSIFDRDRFVLGADITYNYKALDLYIRTNQYLEKHNTTVFNAGLKWNF